MTNITAQQIPATVEPLAKEEPFLLSPEDTEGDQGPLVFPEFVEAFVYLCLPRYTLLFPNPAFTKDDSLLPAVREEGVKCLGG